MSGRSVYARFCGSLSSHWQIAARGSGRLQMSASGLRLWNDGAADRVYANAQIDDYQHLARRDFLWRPPLRLTLRARFSHDSGILSGTAGFGFWNDPFLMTGLRLPALPQAIWFFYAGPRSDMRLALDAPGWGWKAAVINACSWRFVASAPLLALAVPLMRLRIAVAPYSGAQYNLYRRLRSFGQRAMGVTEQWLPVAMRDWHVYTIDWRRESVRFFIDGSLLLTTSHAPAGPLGLVLWLDNQYLQITPWGRFRWGLLAKEEAQWLEIDWLAAERLSQSYF